MDDNVCETCGDTGETVVGDLIMPCPACDLGDWNNVLELADEARRGR